MSWTGARLAALEQAAMVEEHVDQLPEHVVERLDQLLARRTGRRSAGSNSHSAPARREGDRQAAPLARAAPAPRSSRRRRPRSAPKAIAMSSGSAHQRRPERRAGPPRRRGRCAGRARLPTITGCTNSTATWRTSERAAGERPRATRRPPRAKRSAIRWQQRGEPLGLRREEARVGVGPPPGELVDAPAQRPEPPPCIGRPTPSRLTRSGTRRSASCAPLVDALARAWR